MNNEIKEILDYLEIPYREACELKNYITNLLEELKLEKAKNKRLNNGIKELDDMFYETFRISQNGYFSISEWELKEFTDKLKELKEKVGE